MSKNITLTEGSVRGQIKGGTKSTPKPSAHPLAPKPSQGKK